MKSKLMNAICALLALAGAMAATDAAAQISSVKNLAGSAPTSATGFKSTANDIRLTRLANQQSLSAFTFTHATSAPPPALSSKSPIAEAAASAFKIKHRFSYAGGLGVDTRRKKGDSDDMGDFKAGNIAVRYGPYVGAFHASLYSSQKNRGGVQRDTGLMTLTAGYEASHVSGYVEAGLLNGKALETMQDIALALHKRSGIKTLRTSPASSGPSMAFGIKGRYDRSVSLARQLEIGTTAFGTLGNVSTNVGGAAMVTLRFSKSAVGKMDIPDMPAQPHYGTSLQAGFVARAIAHDVRTNAEGTKSFQPEAVFGATVGLKNVSLGLGYSVPLTAEIKGPYQPHVGNYSLKLSARF